MSSNSSAAPPLPDLPQALPSSAGPSVKVVSLDTLRAEIDRLDDEMQDLLLRRAAVVVAVAGLRESGKIPFRPGR